MMRRMLYGMLTATVLAAVGVGGWALYHLQPWGPPESIPVPDREEYLARVATAGPAGADDPAIFPGTPRSRSGRIPREHLERSGSCGLSGCHPDITRQWEQSIHHLASFTNPVYRASVDYTRERQGEAAVRWCAGCHDPVLLMSGEMKGKITAQTPGAGAGVTCLTCHATERIQDLTGNGRYTLNVPDLGPLEADHLLGAPTRALLKAFPAPHKNGLMRPLLQQPEFCSSCHRVGLTKAQNNFHWLRGQDQYGSWLNGGASGRVARSLYTPKQPMRCQDCHMPLVASQDAGNDNGQVRSHAFPGANTAVPGLLGHPGQAALTGAFLKDAVRVDIFAAREYARPGSQDDAVWIAPLEQGSLRAGTDVTVDVVVRNVRVGHGFPEGVLDNKDIWLEVVAKDERGLELWRQGGLDADLELLPTSHQFGATLLDAAGQRIDKRNIGDFRVPLFRRVLGAGQSDVARYRFRVPATVGAVTLEATLRYRKVKRDYTKWAWAGKRPAGQPAPPLDAPYDETRFEIDPSIPVPVLPVIDVASDRVTVPVQGGTAAPVQVARAQKAAPLAERWYDYGVGFMLQQDSSRAWRAFATLTSQFTDAVDGPVGLARVALQNGNPDDALASLEHARTVLARVAASPKPPPNVQAARDRIEALAGQAWLERGDYPKAVSQFEGVLERFPQDRSLWADLAYAFFQQDQLERAVKSYQRVLEIDPDDSGAHQMLARSFQALGRQEDARLHRQIFDALREDVSVQGLRQMYLERHPEAALEVQTGHEHEIDARPVRPGHAVAGALK